MDEDWDCDRDEIVDLDVTGDPQLDQFGYQSPRNVPRMWAHPPASQRDWLAQSRRDRAERQRKRDRQQRQREEARRQRESPPSQSVAPMARGGCYPQVMPQVMRPPRGGDEGWSAAPPVTPPSGPQPGQHGAYFEVRTVRPWYALWRKKRVWQQISAWHMGLPPAGATVVTVPDVAALPGQVHTIGRVNGTGAVEY
jgi:hypothetical protein